MNVCHDADFLSCLKGKVRQLRFVVSFSFFLFFLFFLFLLLQAQTLLKKSTQRSTQTQHSQAWETQILLKNLLYLVSFSSSFPWESPTHRKQKHKTVEAHNKNPRQIGKTHQEGNAFFFFPSLLHLLFSLIKVNFKKKKGGKGNLFKVLNWKMGGK